MNAKFIFLFLTITFLLYNFNLSVSSDQIDQWTLEYDNLLKKYVKQGEIKGITMNLVDYKGIRGDIKFEKLETELSKLPSIKDQPKNKQLAYWINAYNFLTLVKIVRNPGLKSIKDLNKPLTNVWQQTAGILNNEKVTLDQIEHEIIRKEFNEPRIHFAVNCASIGCPDLRSEAYFANKLNEQLQDQLVKFLNNNKKGMYVNDEQKVIYVSKIFNWYDIDFFKNVKLWLQNNGLIEFDAFKYYSVRYLNYDWDLNSIPGRN